MPTDRAVRRRRFLVTSTAGLVCAWALVGAAGEAGGAAAETDAATTQPAAAPLDPAVETILDRLEKKGDVIRDIEANLTFVKTDTIIDDVQKYEGVLRYRKEEPNPRFFIRFDKHVHDRIVRREKEWHVFDGRWYWEARESIKQIHKREVVAPGEKLDAFRIGEGPFPLPFGQKKSDITRNFTVKLIPPGAGEPPGFVGDHLELTPIAGTKMDEKYEAIHLYIDSKLDLPTRVRTTEKEEDNELMVTFANVKENTGLSAEQLALPKLAEYQISEERLDRSP